MRRPKSGVSSAGPCPWVDQAVERNRVRVVCFLLEAGVSQKGLNAALEQALDGKKHLVARELLACNACFPHQPDRFSRALSRPPDMEFIRLWLTAPVEPPREFATHAITKAMRWSYPESQSILSMLLTSYPPSPEELFNLLTKAIT